MEPTQEQKDACQLNKLDITTVERWEGKTMILPYPGITTGNGYALVSEHGSITYCAEIMLEAHLAGIRK